MHYTVPLHRYEPGAPTTRWSIPSLVSCEWVREKKECVCGGGGGGGGGIMLVRKCCTFNRVTYGHDSRHPGLAHSKTLGSS